jgi:hypothetical protein
VIGGLHTGDTNLGIYYEPALIIRQHSRIKNLTADLSAGKQGRRERKD